MKPPVAQLRLFHRFSVRNATFWPSGHSQRSDGYLRITVSVPKGMNKMIPSTTTMAQKIAHAAIAFETQCTGHTPKSVTVVMSDSTLLITLHGALSPAEIALAKSPAGAAQVQSFHRQLFHS